MDAAIVVFDGVDEMDVVGPYEVLCNWLLERFFGADLAARVSRQMEHERRGAVYFGPRAKIAPDW